MSALFTQCPGDTVQTGTGKVDPARKFKCTKAAPGTAVYRTCHQWRAMEGHLKLRVKYLKEKIPIDIAISF